jgi:hypothetical protein
MSDVDLLQTPGCPECDRRAAVFLPGISRRSQVPWFLCRACLYMWSGDDQQLTSGEVTNPIPPSPLRGGRMAVDRELTLGAR